MPRAEASGHALLLLPDACQATDQKNDLFGDRSRDPNPRQPNITDHHAAAPWTSTLAHIVPPPANCRPPAMSAYRRNGAKRYVPDAKDLPATVGRCADRGMIKANP